MGEHPPVTSDTRRRAAGRPEAVPRNLAGGGRGKDDDVARPGAGRDRAERRHGRPARVPLLDMGVRCLRRVLREDRRGGDTTSRGRRRRGRTAGGCSCRPRGAGSRGIRRERVRAVPGRPGRDQRDPDRQRAPDGRRRAGPRRTALRPFMGPYLAGEMDGAGRGQRDGPGPAARELECGMGVRQVPPSRPGKGRLLPRNAGAGPRATQSP